jgi:predicted dehydrogenase
MKQVIQSYKTGEVRLRDVPSPQNLDGRILVQNASSLISIGTEKLTIELGKKSLFGKAAARPDLVRRAWSKAKKEGLMKTWQEAMGRLDEPTPLGYSSSGFVIESGLNVSEFTSGDRVACVGQGFASHAEFISVPVNLACRIPDNVSYIQASFGMLGIIALHGIRTANITFGSKVLVVGLGLLGLLSAQILRAYGCDVIAFDIDLKKLELAKKLGFLNLASSEGELLQIVNITTGLNGVDAVIIAAATSSKDPIVLGVKASRHKGRIVIVGVVDVHPDRNELWQKEVEVIVSRAAGPGSLDPLYEVGGIDLPIGDVRWTLKRNLVEFLRLLSQKMIDVDVLITHSFDINNAETVYSDLMSGALSSPIAVMLSYSNSQYKEAVKGFNKYEFTSENKDFRKDKLSLCVVGAGLFAKALMLPTLSRNNNVNLYSLISSTGAQTEQIARKYKFKNFSTTQDNLWLDKNVDAIVGLTPHRNHFDMAIKAINFSKPLFIEKPICVSLDELDKLENAFTNSQIQPIVFVGHNRRYSPHTNKICEWLSNRNTPMVIQMRVNSGYIPREHWTHSELEGRSRIVGEMSHFVDLFLKLTGSMIKKIHAERVSGDDAVLVNNDNLTVVFKFEDGSIANLTYSASGDRGFPREMFEIFVGNQVITCNDYRVSQLFKGGKVIQFKTRSQEIGYKEEVDCFIDIVRAKRLTSDANPSLYMHGMRAIFSIEKSLSSGKAVLV